MKLRPTQAPGLSATLYPPCTMRVQPHFPSRPLVTMVTPRSRLALCACSAANRPAPPEPRIKMSVLRRSRGMGSSEQARQQDERDDRRQSGRDRRQLFLFVAPIEILDHQQAQSSQHVHHEEKDDTAFGELDQRLIAPAQEAFQRRFALNGEAERQEMQRQENSERQAGKPVHQRRDPKHALAMGQSPRPHGSTTAATARTPRRSSSNPKALAKMLALRSLSGDHSVSTLRTPIPAWIATATTKAP